jgi:hypothetical protein
VLECSILQTGPSNFYRTALGRIPANTRGMGLGQLDCGAIRLPQFVESSLPPSALNGVHANPPCWADLAWLSGRRHLGLREILRRASAQQHNIGDLWREPAVRVTEVNVTVAALTEGNE